MSKTAAIDGQTSCQLNTSPFVMLKISPRVAGVSAAQASARASNRASTASCTPGGPPGNDSERPRSRGERRVDADDRDQVHGAAERLTEDDLRPEHRPRPGRTLGPRPQGVLLAEVEVVVLVAWRPLLRREWRAAEVESVGLRALEQAHVLEGRAVFGDDRLERVAEHVEIALDELDVAPASREIARFLQGRVDDMRRAPEDRRADGVHRRSLVSEIDGRVDDPGQIDRPARDGDDVTSDLGAEVLDRGVTDDTRRSQHHDLHVGRAEKSATFSSDAAREPKW